MENKNSLLTALAKRFGFNVEINDDDEDNQTAILSPIAPDVPDVSEGIQDDLLKNVADVSHEVASLREQLGGEEGITSLVSTLNDVRELLQNQQAEQSHEKEAIIAQVLANTSVYTEEELKGMKLNALKKISAVMSLPEVDYSLAAAGVQTNDGGSLAVPAVFFAPREVKEA